MSDCMDNNGFRPRIAAFFCNWCTYGGADLAGVNRLRYPADFRVVRLPCTGRMNPEFILHAFRQGVDGVWVSGCHPGDCHYIAGNMYARRRFTMLKELLEYVGLDPGRLHFSWISSAEAEKFQRTAKEVIESVRALGPVDAANAATKTMVMELRKVI
ncbi:hydrogenase iron-sulfur subunit [Desulfolutivibrio sulfoxidireducens]|uniref:hydrogenase iron-sulfur subunit n=1 Tax=Desulfolutivibrio sulfoxidireducens TaxID=2773299 RepID=UPI00210A4FA1|nr:hydrogenase iron-sulfur subunit [Desulfolutivibrio sulfoxidireducens]